MKWITRESPKIDRIACPWLIKNFVDKEADFIYVLKEKVFEKAKDLNAIPYDIPGAEYSHYGNECTFDFILKKHQLNDSALYLLAKIVRGADTDQFDLAPQAAGRWPRHSRQDAERDRLLEDAAHARSREPVERRREAVQEGRGRQHRRRRWSSPRRRARRAGLDQARTARPRAPLK